MKFYPRYHAHTGLIGQGDEAEDQDHRRGEEIVAWPCEGHNAGIATVARHESRCDGDTFRLHSSNIQAMKKAT